MEGLPRTASMCVSIIEFVFVGAPIREAGAAKVDFEQGSHCRDRGTDKGHVYLEAGGEFGGGPVPRHSTGNVRWWC